MKEKIIRKRNKLSFTTLKEYLQSKNIKRYILSSTYQKECINAYTLRMNVYFENMDIFYNPNKVFLYGSQSNPDDKCNYSIIERIKHAKVDEFDNGVVIDFVCGNLLDNDDNHTYTVFAEI